MDTKFSESLHVWAWLLDLFSVLFPHLKVQIWMWLLSINNDSCGKSKTSPIFFSFWDDCIYVFINYWLIAVFTCTHSHRHAHRHRCLTSTFSSLIRVILSSIYSGFLHFRKKVFSPQFGFLRHATGLFMVWSPYFTSFSCCLHFWVSLSTSHSISFSQTNSSFD